MFDWRHDGNWHYSNWHYTYVFCRVYTELFYVIVYGLLPSPKDVNNGIYIAKAPKQYFGWVIGCGDVLRENIAFSLINLTDYSTTVQYEDTM